MYMYMYVSSTISNKATKQIVKMEVISLRNKTKHEFAKQFLDMIEILGLFGSIHHTDLATTM